MNQGPGQGATPKERPEPRRRLISEARKLAWGQLLENTEEALCELLDWLQVAVKSGQKSSPYEPDRFPQQQLSTSFLINGLRGYGKTTVLMTAEHALDRKSTKLDAFFKGNSKDPKKADAVRRQLEFLRPRIIWLRILDLELLDRNANLLAFLLVQIRSALDSTFGTDVEGSKRIPASILGGRIENTWQTLDRLVSDASFMWEDIIASTRHERAEQQISAADTFVSFTNTFKNAMPDVVKSMSVCETEEPAIMVLPIDNVDRSIEHLASIVKLIRMAYSPRLWFVLAAGRPDFQLFLQRSFERELLSWGRPSPSAPRPPGEESDIRFIARRQAATTMIRILPPSYQIGIESVKPEEAWNFADEEPYEEPSDNQRLRSLLGQFSLPPSLEEFPAPSGAARLMRLEAGERSGGEGDARVLFELSERLDPGVRDMYLAAEREDSPECRPAREGASIQGAPETPPLWTYAGRMALNCSPRTLRDFSIALASALNRLAAYGALPADRQKTRPPTAALQDDKAREEEAQRRANSLRQSEQLVQVLVQMLRSAVEESNLPSWASEMLNHDIIHVDTNNRWVFDLRDSPIQRVRQAALERKIDCSRRDLDSETEICKAWSTELQLRQLGDVNFDLHERGEAGRSHPLPLDVAGWLMLCHDLLVAFPYNRVPSQSQRMIAYQLNPEFLATLHWLPFDGELVELTFLWKPPQWATFLDYDVFIAQWMAFLRASRPLVSSPLQKMKGEETDPTAWRPALLQLRLLMAAWVDNVCSVAGDHNRGHWSWPDSLRRLLGLLGLKGQKLETEESFIHLGKKEYRQAFLDDLRLYEEHVQVRVIDLWIETANLPPSLSRPRVAREWLMETLPLLVLPEYSPHWSSTRLLDFEKTSDDKSAQAKPLQSELLKWWRDANEPLCCQRRQIVRSAAMASPTYRAMQQSGRCSCKYLRGWLDRFVNEWFRSVDRRVDTNRRTGAYRSTLRLDGDADVGTRSGTAP